MSPVPSGKEWVVAVKSMSFGTSKRAVTLAPLSFSHTRELDLPDSISGTPILHPVSTEFYRSVWSFENLDGPSWSEYTFTDTLIVGIFVIAYILKRATVKMNDCCCIK